MLTKRESDALNLLRWTSTVAIVVCHLLQASGSDWCWVFNIGVQVFFFLSGFLYGGRRIAGIKKFYVGRLLKIYLPYALWIAVAIGLLVVFSPGSVTPLGVVKQALMRSSLPGLAHTWFMYVIMVCYLWLPAVDRLVSRSAVAGLLTLGLVFGLLFTFSYAALYVWVALYYAGYLCGRYRAIVPYVFAAACVALAALLWSEGFSLATFKVQTVANTLIHASAGIALSLGVFLGVRRVELHPKISQILTNGGGTRSTSFTICSYSGRCR